MNTLALIAKKSPSVKPPFRKSEVIEALAIRKLAQLSEQQAAANMAYAKANASVTALAIEHLKTSGSIEGEPYCYLSNNSGETYVVSGRVELKHVPAELRQSIRSVQKAKAALIRRLPTLWDLKKQIRDSMAGQNTDPSTRLHQLLNEPTLSKALDTTLAALDKEANAAPVNV